MDTEFYRKNSEFFLPKDEKKQRRYCFAPSYKTGFYYRITRTATRKRVNLFCFLFVIDCRQFLLLAPLQNARRFLSKLRFLFLKFNREIISSFKEAVCWCSFINLYNYQNILEPELPASPCRRNRLLGRRVSRSGQ